MLQNAPPKATNAFMDAAAVTMADLIAMVAKDEDLTSARCRNLASSIRRFCAALGYDPAQVPGDMLAFKERLKRFHPLSAGIKKKRWQTIKADVTFALNHAGLTKGLTRGLAPLTPGWLAFKAADPSPQFMWGFSRLAHFGSAAGIEPTAVNDRVIADFTTALDKETFKTNTSRLLRELCTRWNKIRREHPGLGLQALTEPSFRKKATVDWSELPATFRK